MKWFITGGCGFIGTSLVERLIQNPANKIRIFDNLETGNQEDLARVANFATKANADCFTDVELVVADIKNNLDVEKHMEGADVVVHLAAKPGVRESVVDPTTSYHYNVRGTFNVFEAARRNGIKQVIFASSGACVGDYDPPITEDMFPNPISPYGATKICGEMMAAAYYHAYEMNIASLRFSNVYGPLSNHKNSLVAKFIRSAIYGKILEIYGDGAQTRDFIYTHDLINAIQLCVQKRSSGTYQVCTGEETSVNDITGMLVDILQRRGITGIEVIHTEPKVGDLRTNWASNEKIGKLGWKPKMSLQKGLEETVSWFLQQKTDSPD